MSGLENFIAQSRKWWPTNLKKDGAYNWRMILVGALGVALLLAGSLFDSASVKTRQENQAETAKNPPVASRSYEEALEAKLANLLSQVKGAGSVAVSITLENSNTQEFAKNTTHENRTIQEKDNNGGLRTTTETKESEQVLLSKENGVDRPVMVRETKPLIKGVLVIAEGAGDSAVKASLTRAVEAGLGVPVYKITVLPQRK
jgi:stage III sporulation protein AG